MGEQMRTIIEVDKFIEDLPGNIQIIASALRKIILDSSPDLVEEFKWSMPNYSYNGLVCFLQPAAKHLNLGFHKGNELQEKDINKLLTGTGKSMRHIKIKNLEDIKPEEFINLIQAAMSLNEKR